MKVEKIVLGPGRHGVDRRIWIEERECEQWDWGLP